MINDNDSLFLMKFSQRKWINKIVDGELSFATIGSYISISKNGSNDEQGDVDEGVFARLKKGDSKIHDLELALGNDLEIINDDEFVKLRRKSSKYLPAFCLYSCRAIDALEVAEPTTNIQTVTISIDKKLYDYFSKGSCCLLNNNHIQSQLIIQPLPFRLLLHEAMFNSNIKYISKNIDYDIKSNDTYYIKPTDNYDELFTKTPKYSYQKEARVILPEISLPTILSRKSIYLRQLLQDDYRIIDKIKISVDMNIKLMRK